MVDCGLFCKVGHSAEAGECGGQRHKHSHSIQTFQSDEDHWFVHWFLPFKVLMWDAAGFSRLGSGMIFSKCLHVSFKTVLYRGPYTHLTSLVSSDSKTEPARPREQSKLAACVLGDVLIDY